jgi:hypothetical protein
VILGSATRRERERGVKERSHAAAKLFVGAPVVPVGCCPVKRPAQGKKDSGCVREQEGSAF